MSKNPHNGGQRSNIGQYKLEEHYPPDQIVRVGWSEFQIKFMALEVIKIEQNFKHAKKQRAFRRLSPARYEEIEKLMNSSLAILTNNANRIRDLAGRRGDGQHRQASTNNTQRPQGGNGAKKPAVQTQKPVPPKVSAPTVAKTQATIVDINKGQPSVEATTPKKTPVARKPRKTATKVKSAAL